MAAKKGREEGDGKIELAVRSNAGENKTERESSASESEEEEEEGEGEADEAEMEPEPEADAEVGAEAEVEHNSSTASSASSSSASLDGSRAVTAASCARSPRTRFLMKLLSSAPRGTDICVFLWKLYGNSGLRKKSKAPR